MLLELKFFKDANTLVWIVTAQIRQLVNDDPTRAIDCQVFNLQVTLFPDIYVNNRLADLGANSPSCLLCRFYRSSLIGNCFCRRFCWRPSALLLFFHSLLS